MSCIFKLSSYSVGEIDRKTPNTASEVKAKGESETYTQLNAEFQRITRRGKKPYSVDNAEK